MNVLGLIVSIIIIIIVIGFNMIKSYLLYYPTKIYLETPSNMLQQIGGHFTFQDIKIKHKDDYLSGWLFIQNKDAPTILLSHGNAGNISHRGHLIQMLCQMGANVCLYDYAGYGQSTGQPSEKQFYKDGEIILKHLINGFQIPKNRIILMGESIGCGVAAYLAQKYQCSKLILLSGFTSIKMMFYHLIPTWLSFLKFFGLFTNEFPVDKYLAQFEGQTLILHSQTDDLIPYQQAVTNACNKGCQLLEIAGTHNQPIFTNDVLDKFKNFMDIDPPDHVDLDGQTGSLRSQC